MQKASKPEDLCQPSLESIAKHINEIERVLISIVMALDEMDEEDEGDSEDEKQ